MNKQTSKHPQKASYELVSNLQNKYFFFFFFFFSSPITITNSNPSNQTTKN
jgi:hypothetical protein